VGNPQLIMHQYSPLITRGGSIPMKSVVLGFVQRLICDW